MRLNKSLIGVVILSTSLTIFAKNSSRGNGTYRIHGKTYHVLKSNTGYDKKGYASWYGAKFNGRPTATGERFNMYAMTAASPTLRIPSYVKVTNLENHKSIVVKVNDRGPYRKGRILDLSYGAAAKLGMLKKGTAYVDVKTIHHA